MESHERIAQFENMAKADPGNEMAHFSLGKALFDAGRFKEAADSFGKCVGVAPGMSKAYQMWGDSLLKAGMRDEAAAALSKGFEVAAMQGDMMPRNAMEKLLIELGKGVPVIQGSSASVPVEEGRGGFVCRQSGKSGSQMAKPPFRGPIGAWIYENISAETFQQWVGQGTKVINELRLDLSREEDAETYDRYMREFLGIDSALYQQLRGNAKVSDSDR